MLYFLAISAALAYESNPQSVLVADEVPLFSSVEIDSGWVPDSGNLGVRVQISANGIANVEQEGDALLVHDSRH